MDTTNKSKADVLYPSPEITEGPFLSVLIFDGIDDHIQLPAANIDYSQGFTVEAWVQHKSFRYWSRIIDFGNGQGKSNIVLGNVGTSNALGLHLFANNGNYPLDASNALEIGKWTHLAATIDKSGMAKLYKNGQLLQSKQLSLPDNLNRTLNYIGKSNWGHDGYFDGQMTEVRVWNYARSESEIKRYMRQQFTGNETGLVSYWPLNEGAGNTAQDKTSNKNHGAIKGATWGKSRVPIHQFCYQDLRTNFYLVDTANKRIKGNGEITWWAVIAGNIAPVQLIIYRKEANTWSVVGKSEVETALLGPNKFALTTPIKVNQGDFAGIYQPGANCVMIYAPKGAVDYTGYRGDLSGRVLCTASGASATAFSDSCHRTYGYTVNFRENIIAKTEPVLTFDGIDNYVQLPAANTDYSQGFTVEAWVQYKSFRNWSRIIDFGNGAGKNNILLGNVEASNALGLHLYHDNGIHILDVPNALEIGKWTHLVATIDKSGMAKLYKNGQLLQSKQLSLPDNQNRTLNYIGKSNWGHDGYFDGQMTEVSVWNYARSESEIKGDMSQRLKGNETGLVGYWPLNEGAENVAKDKTSNKNDGAIKSATWGKSELPLTGTKDSVIAW